jgi:hypothetical protein
MKIKTGSVGIWENYLSMWEDKAFLNKTQSSGTISGKKWRNLTT